MWFERKDDETINEDSWKQEESNAHAHVVLQSLLQIHCTRSGQGDVVDDLIGLAVRQQTCALAQPLSAFQWAICMRQRGVTSVDDFVTRYNGHHTVTTGGAQLQFSRKRQWVSSNNI
jgi:hypothetical protein